ncbi:unnamed protein product [Periconia digitata]|uniref:Uncharacterized protein n=1 Tax=Periconia digitata TaxID=1303443 RepID=A0A9W4XR19_9PLEO|nr:unnamed protein product [Periconia digitata]
MIIFFSHPPYTSFRSATQGPSLSSCGIQYAGATPARAKYKTSVARTRCFWPCFPRFMDSIVLHVQLTTEQRAER